MNRIIKSFGIIVFVGAVVVGATGAFFSDEESSLGNVFAAGSVNLEIDEIQHYYQGDLDATENPAPVGFGIDGNTFSFDDLKPGDWGRLQFDLENTDNQVHLCAMVDENNESEGPLGDFLRFQFEQGGYGFLSEVAGVWQSLGIVESGDSTDKNVHYCFGEIDNDSCVVDTNKDYNPAQGSKLGVDILLYAVQTRNNENFNCNELNDLKVVNQNTGNTYETISAALGTVQENQTILVPRGVYNEAVVINTDGVTLKFNPNFGGTATIQSDVAGDPGVVGIDADNVTLDGFVIDNLDPNDDIDNRLVRVRGTAEGAVITNNTFNNSRRGVQGDWSGGSANTEITNNTFNTEFGLAGTEDWTGLYVAGNTFNTNQEGIGIGVGAEFVDENGNEPDDYVHWLNDNNDFTGATGNTVKDYR